mmetsp:Transcript_39961/g.123476  ORF Transcript_39961/g.123476 Transcript_39961/m.123476 type:complete len:292 (-) Transcript_39961:121-996(-)
MRRAGGAACGRPREEVRRTCVGGSAVVMVRMARRQVRRTDPLGTAARGRGVRPAEDVIEAGDLDGGGLRAALRRRAWRRRRAAGPRRPLRRHASREARLGRRARRRHLDRMRRRRRGVARDAAHARCGDTHTLRLRGEHLAVVGEREEALRLRADVLVGRRLTHRVVVLAALVARRDGLQVLRVGTELRADVGDVANEEPLEHREGLGDVAPVRRLVVRALPHGAVDETARLRRVARHLRQLLLLLVGRPPRVGVGGVFRLLLRLGVRVHRSADVAADISDRVVCFHRTVA